MDTSYTGISLPTDRLPANLSENKDKGKTSAFKLAPAEYFIACPYDTAHFLTNERMVTHLPKCRRNYIFHTERSGRKVQYVSCPYQSCAPFPRPELEYHQERCSKYDDVQDLLFTKSKKYQEIVKASAAARAKREAERAAKVGGSDESWEKEAMGYESGYDPREKLIGENILINPIGATKTERREFRRLIIQRAEERSTLPPVMKPSAELSSHRDPYEALYGGVTRDNI